MIQKSRLVLVVAVSLELFPRQVSYLICPFSLVSIANLAQGKLDES